MLYDEKTIALSEEEIDHRSSKNLEEKKVQIKSFIFSGNFI